MLTPNKLTCALTCLGTESFLNYSTNGDIAQMVERALDKFFSSGPEFKSW